MAWKVQEALDVSAALFVSYMTGGGVNAKLDLSGKHAMSEYDVSLVIKCTITGPNYLRLGHNSIFSFCQFSLII